MMRWYEVTATEDDNGSWLITSPTFPELATFGRNRSKAFAGAALGLQAAITARIETGASLPSPETGYAGERSHVSIPHLAYIKICLYLAMKDAKVSGPVLAGRLKTTPDRVERLLRIEHNSQLDLLTAALEEVGMSISIEVRRRER